MGWSKNSKKSGGMPDWAAPLLGIIVVVGLLIVAGTWAVAGIIESQENSSREHIITGDALPTNATGITDVGNGWHEFNYKGKRYLYHSSEVGYGAQECIVEIGK